MSHSRLLYGAAVFLSAFLLFLIEPIAAKQVLPALGGSSAVWMTCLVFFQLMLLLGYLYAHWLTRMVSPRRQPVVHIALLAAALIPPAIPALAHLYHPDSARALTLDTNHPALAIFIYLARTIGFPFLLLASTSPLLQVWLAHTEGGIIRFRLFALSNVGSLLALLLYPSLIEPYISLSRQSLLWTIGFLLFGIVCSVIANRIARPGPSSPHTPLPIEEELNDSAVEITPASRSHKLLWFLLPMAAAMQLSAVTGHLTQNIAAIPLLWVLPLAVYLITFILAFDAPNLYRRWLVVRLLVILLASLGYMLTKTDMSLPIVVSIVFFLIEILLACYFCHAETFLLRPQRTSEATLFYLLIAAGGVTGTFFIGIACPLIFDANYDIAISFAVTAAVALAVTWNDGRNAWPQRLLWSVATVLMCVVLVMMHIAYSHGTLAEVRNFYAPLRVRESHFPPRAFTVRTFLNGTIEHGTQWFAADMRKQPTSYYAPNSGIGLALTHCCLTSDGQQRPRNVGVIGLGSGTIAVYGLPGDHITFYEINPAVEPIARNLFTYIRESGAQVNVAEGDARISLVNQPPQNYDVIAVDAFSGDAIPLHLLTREAMAVYLRHLKPSGLLVIHVSNQYLDLPPEIQLLADSAGMKAGRIQSAPDEEHGRFIATWIVLTRDASFFDQPEVAYAARPIRRQAGLRLWTDDYSSLLPILQWHGH